MAKAQTYTVYSPVYDDEYRKLAKRMNQRMVEAEHRGITTPGIKAMQGALDTLGRKRFSETGKAASQEELDFMKAQLKRFEAMDTTTVSGYKEYRESIIKTAREKYDLDELGISDDDYLSIWENLPDDKAQRAYGSDVYIAVTRAVVRKYGEDMPDDIASIIGTLESADNYKDALKQIGISSRAVNKELRMLKYD